MLLPSRFGHTNRTVSAAAGRHSAADPYKASQNPCPAHLPLLHGNAFHGGIPDPASGLHPGTMRPSRADEEMATALKPCIQHLVLLRVAMVRPGAGGGRGEGARARGPS